jgi:transposase
MVHLVRKEVKGNIYLYLEETARVNGKPKRIWSKYLGPENSIKDASKLGLSLEASEINPIDFGLPVALMKIVKQLDLIKIIDQATFKRQQGFSVGEYMVISAINRCVNPVSKHQIQEWFENSFISQTFSGRETYLNSMAYSNHYDYLTDQALEKIEDALATKLKRDFHVDMSQLMYDPTNFYTYNQGDEDEEEGLAQFGHGKEGRASLRIVGLSLVCSQDGGVPLFSHSYPGNIPDASLFKSQAKIINTRIKKLDLGEESEVLLTFDKGNNSDAAFAEFDKGKAYFLASLRPSMVKDLAEIPMQNFFHTALPNNKDVGLIEFERPFYGKPRRLIVVYNRDLALRQGGLLLEKLEERKEQILEFFQERLNVKKWRSVAAVQKKIDEMIPKYQQDLLSVNLIEELDSLSLHVEIDYTALIRKTTQMGKTYLITNHPTKPASELVRLFRQQITVERAFRFLKSPDIFRVRPIHVHNDSSIKGHLFTCVLGLLLLTLLTREVQKSRDHYSLEEIVGLLSTIKLIEINIPGTQRTIRRLTKLTPKSQDLVELLGLAKDL